MAKSKANAERQGQPRFGSQPGPHVRPSIRREPEISIPAVEPRRVPDPAKDLADLPAAPSSSEVFFGALWTLRDFIEGLSNKARSEMTGEEIAQRTGVPGEVGHALVALFKELVKERQPVYAPDVREGPKRQKVRTGGPAGDEGFELSTATFGDPGQRQQMQWLLSDFARLRDAARQAGIEANELKKAAAEGKVTAFNLGDGQEVFSITQCRSLARAASGDACCSQGALGLEQLAQRRKSLPEIDALAHIVKQAQRTAPPDKALFVKLVNAALENHAHAFLIDETEEIARRLTLDRNGYLMFQLTGGGQRKFKGSEFSLVPYSRPYRRRSR